MGGAMLSSEAQTHGIGLVHTMEGHGSGYQPQILDGLGIFMEGMTREPVSIDQVGKSSLAGNVPLFTGGNPDYNMEPQHLLGSSELYHSLLF